MSPRHVMGPVLAALALFGCPGPKANPPVGPPQGPGLGSACLPGSKCRDGLTCNPATLVCEGDRATPDGAACLLGVECISGNCAPNGARGQCAPSGPGAQGTSCQGDSDCAAPLKCGFDGEHLFPECLPTANHDLGQACTLGLECAQGLLCVESVCTAVSLGADKTPHGVPPALPAIAGAGWPGATCPAPKATAETALFVLPREGDDAAVKEDFYRLPFPNDALRDAAGRIDFSRHPKDPAPAFGFDLLGRYFEALASEPYGNAPTIIYRFDGPIDFATVQLQTDPTVRLVKLTPSQGSPRGLTLQSNPGANRYVCGNWLGVRPYDGDSLKPGAYALVLTKGLKGKTGADIAPSPDFTAMLQATAPTDARQALAWPAYAPLRAWVVEQHLTNADLVGATVFTVADPRRLLNRLATSVAARPVPAADAWVKCGSGAPSPCPDATGLRACGAANAAFDEWHALIELPIYQQGTAPYLTPAQGGGIDGSTAALVPVRTEKVCASLTVPTGAAPSSGWPVVLSAHGTGGTFRGHAGDGAAAALSGITLPGVADPVKAAVLGFDQVGHGPRRGVLGQRSTPEDLVFNFANPASARGTMAQGGADLLGVARYVKSLPGSPPPGLPKLDPTHLVFWGHSQGATEGALFLALDRSVDGALLSGASATLVNSLVSKKAPVNIADGLWAALSESSPAAISVYHPVLSLLQMWSDPVDPLHFASRATVVPAEGATPAFARHVFQVWGKDDLYTPRPVQTSFAHAAALAFVGPKVDDFNATEVTSASGNVSLPRPVTAALRQYVPEGYDGHFVVFRNPSATTDATRFVARVLRGEVPTVPEP